MNDNRSDKFLLTETVCNYWLKQLNSIERHLGELDNRAVNTVHDLRVAARRCQSTAEVGKPFLPDGWAKRICQILKPLRKACDQVRDMEVLLDWLTSLPEPQLITAGLLDVLRRQYEIAWQNLNKTLSRKNLRCQIHELAIDIQSLIIKSEPEGFQLEDVSAALLTACMAQITTYHHTIDFAASPDAVPKELHELRIAGKQFRYVLEMLQPALNDSSKALLENFIRFQDSLGALHDRLRFSEMLEDLAESPSLQKNIPELIFTALNNELSRQKQLCWQDFHQLWKGMTAVQMIHDIFSILSLTGGQ